MKMIMSPAHLNVALLSAIALLIAFLLGLSGFQKWAATRHRAGSTFASRMAPGARWLLGLLIVAYILFIAFQMRNQLAPVMR